MEKAVKNSRNGIKISIEVSPCSEDVSINYNEWRECFGVRIKSPPEKGKANHELELLFSSILMVPVKISSGHKSSRKILSASNINAADAIKKIREYAGI